MNLSEFKAWFEGFTEAMDKPPTAKQWKRIKERVDEITSDPTPWPIFVDRYVYPNRPYWVDPIWVTTCGSFSNVSSNTIPQETPAQAFTYLGRFDFEQITAN